MSEYGIDSKVYFITAVQTFGVQKSIKIDRHNQQGVKSHCLLPSSFNQSKKQLQPFRQASNLFDNRNSSSRSINTGISNPGYKKHARDG
jgi:hypothetical protein